jgi:hypothetical protein
VFCKVKYKKHKKNPKNGQVKGQAEKQKGMVTTEHGIPPHLVNGTILKTALTNPSEVRQQFFLLSFFLSFSLSFLPLKITCTYYLL